MHETEPFDSEDETLEELYGGEDDAEGEADDDENEVEQYQEDPLLANGDNTTEDGEDVCVPGILLYSLQINTDMV